MNKVTHILSLKGSDIVSVPSGTTVLEALRLMDEKNIGSVVVTSPDGKYQGIVTERDYSRKVILKGKSSTDTLVEEIMSTALPNLTPQDTIEYCMELMTQNNVRYLPVFSGMELRGIISMSDVVKQTIIMQKETIEHLQNYISL